MRNTRKMLLAAIALVLMGCQRDDQIHVYNAPKEPVMAAAEAGDAAPQQPITWTAPKSWTQLPAQEMRFATFQVSANNPQVVLTVIPLNSSPVLMNLNRWEQQLGLPATPEAEMSKKVSTVKTQDGSEASVMDLSNDKQRMLAAMIPHDGRTWFFKLVGPTEIVGAEKENFDAFIKSIRFNDGAAAPEQKAELPKLPSGHPALPDQPALPSGHPALPANGDAGAAKAPAGGGLETWNTPKDWTEEPPKPMRAVSFFVNGSNGQNGEVIVTQMDANFFGSVLDNINRWRGQVGLEKVKSEAEAKPETIKVGDKELKFYDFVGAKAGDQPARRILVTMIINGPSVYFFKLQGSSDLVDQQKQAFVDFLSSVKFAQAK